MMNEKSESTNILVNNFPAALAACRKSITINPMDKVSIWFESGAEPGTIIDGAIFPYAETDLTVKNNVKLHYKNQGWSIQ